jgi:hypothetical protein
MRVRQSYPGLMVILVVGLALVLVSGRFTPASAGTEDVAMFYDELSQHGQWVQYENYGPVWTPGQVGESWRPYSDGRWVPTRDGYVFETREPWGWATYHYGNWMPTESYGWVWVPGRTWYPSTVAWRTSPEGTPAEAAYVGWAPIPPPNYVPSATYQPAGYYSGMPAADMITAPFYIFAAAARFLLGFGMPFSQSYTYIGCGCLAPPVYLPTFYSQTVIIQNYVVPTYYPTTFLGMGGFAGAYSWGPPIPYIARWSNLNPTVLNQTIINNSVNIVRINNIMPPGQVLSRHGYLRQIMPPSLAQGQPLPQSQPARDLRMAQANLGRPNLVAAPRQVPQVSLGSIPRAAPMSAQGPTWGTPGAGLPSTATHPLTPNMQQRVNALPGNQRIVPTTPMRPSTATGPGAPGMAPTGPGARGPAAGQAPGAPSGGRQMGTPGMRQATPGAPTPGAQQVGPSGARTGAAPGAPGGTSGGTAPAMGGRQPGAGAQSGTPSQAYRGPSAPSGGGQGGAPSGGYRGPAAGPGHREPGALSGGGPGGGTGGAPSGGTRGPAAGPQYRQPQAQKAPAVTQPQGARAPTAQQAAPRAASPPQPAAKKPAPQEGEKKSPPHPQ